MKQKLFTSQIDDLFAAQPRMFQACAPQKASDAYQKLFASQFEPFFTAQLCSSIHLKRLVLDEGNPWATSQQFSLYEQISSTVNVGDTDLCSTVSFDLLEKSLSANCADFINSLSQGCAAARVLAFKKEFSSTKTTSAAVHITVDLSQTEVRMFRWLEVSLSQEGLQEEGLH